MRIADAHADTLYLLALEGRALDACAVRPETLEKGGVALQTFALFPGTQVPEISYYENTLRMLDKILALGIPMLLERLPDEPPQRPSGILSIEGGEAIMGDMAKLEELHGRGRIRMLALTWNRENETGYPAMGGSSEGLKPFGRALIRRMDELGILVDVSHLNEAGFYQAADQSRLPILASHSNLRTLCENPRNLTKDQVRVIMEKRGFIGINFYAPFVCETGTPGVDDVVRHIDAIAELGGIDVLGFGSDFDGIELWPESLPDPSGFPILISRLRALGYTQQQLSAIAFGNLWRVLKQAEQAARQG